MSRYIDAEKIDWRLIEVTNMIPAEEHMITMARRLIDRQPTADVKPVVRGEWVDANQNNSLDPRVTCSICGNTEVLHKANYCPNCGADMKGGDAEWLNR